MKLKNWLFFIIFISSLILLFSFTSDNSKAQTCWWDGEGGDNLASTAANWNSNGGNDIAPTTGDNVVFDGTSVKTCTWDVTVTLGDMTLAAGYTGLVQFTTNIGYVNFSMAGGRWFASTTLWQTCYGDWTKTGGTIDPNRLKIEFAKDGGTVTGGISFKDVLFSGNTSFTGGVYGCTVDSDVIVTFPGLVNCYTAGAGYSNSGAITGTGPFVFYLNGDYELALGVIDCPLEIKTSTSTTVDRTVTLTANAAIGDTMTVYSADGTYTMTLDTAGYNLSCTGAFETGVRGIIDLGEGTHTFGGNFDGVATGSDVTPGTSTVILNGTNQNIQLNSDDSFYDLAIQSNDTNCLSSININHNLYFINRYPNEDYTFDNATSEIGKYSSNGEGEIHIGIIILGIGNDYSTSIVPFILIITSNPETTAYIDIDYLYEVLINAGGQPTINFTSNATFIYLYVNGIYGTPEIYQAGSYWINITAEYNTKEAYQNYTLGVEENMIFETGMTMAIAMVFLISLTIINLIGFIKGIPIVVLIIGVVTVFSTISMLTVFSDMAYIPLAFLLINIALMAIGLAKLR